MSTKEKNFETAYYLRIDDELLERVRQYAKERGWTSSMAIRIAMLRMVNDKQ